MKVDKSLKNLSCPSSDNLNAGALQLFNISIQREKEVNIIVLLLSPSTLEGFQKSSTR